MATRPYRELVGAVSWLAYWVYAPDIAFAASSLARVGHNPRCVHWEAAKRVLRYLKGTRGGVLPSEEDRLRSLDSWTRTGAAIAMIDGRPARIS